MAKKKKPTKKPQTTKPPRKRAAEEPAITAGGAAEVNPLPPTMNEFEMFPSAAAATAWGHENFSAGSAFIDSNIQKAISHYTGSGYDSINNHLRLGSYLGQTGQNHIGHLDRLFETAPATTKDVVVFRGLSGKRIPSKVGDVWTDKGYTSNSLTRGVARNFAAGKEKGVVLQVSVPKGSRGLYLESVTSVGGEHEFLTQRNVTYRVTGSGGTVPHPYIHGQTLPVIKVEIVGMGPNNPYANLKP